METSDWEAALERTMLMAANKEVSRLPDEEAMMMNQTSKSEYKQRRQQRQEKRLRLEKVLGWWGKRRESRMEQECVRACCNSFCK